MSGFDDIYTERARQVQEEGWSPESDDEYTRGQLVRAAEAYRAADASSPMPDYWPWDSSHWKPTSRIRNLTKAGALYLAEADRRGRAGESDTSVHAALNSATLCARAIDELREEND